MGYFYIFGTIFFTVYGQLILKWRMSALGGSLPNEFLDKILFLFKLVFFISFNILETYSYFVITLCFFNNFIILGLLMLSILLKSLKLIK